MNTIGRLHGVQDLGWSLLVLLVLLSGCCQPTEKGPAPETAKVQTAKKAPVERKASGTAQVAGCAWAYFKTNDVTEIRYVRFPSYIGVADAKPVKILSVRGLSPKDDADTLALLDKADIASWKTFYEDDRVSDGMHWTVEIVSDDKVVKRITGFNAEPPGLRFLLRAAGLDRRRRELDDD